MTIPVGYAQVTHRFSGPSCPEGAVVTFGLDQDSGTSVQDLAEAAHTVWIDNIIPVQVTDCFLESTLVKYGPDSTGPSAEFAQLEAGLVSAPSVPPQVSLLVQKQTNLGGRQGRGRMYVPGFREDALQANGFWVGGDHEDYQDAFSAWQTVWEGSPHNLVLLHGDSLAPTPITNINVDTRAATQRKRLRR